MNFGFNYALLKKVPDLLQHYYYYFIPRKIGNSDFGGGLLKREIPDLMTCQEICFCGLIMFLGTVRSAK